MHVISAVMQRLTIHLPKHGSHVLKVVVVKKPHTRFSLILIKWHYKSQHQEEGNPRKAIRNVATEYVLQCKNSPA